MESRIVFMGSPQFAVPILDALYERFNVVGVVSQPDRKSGRGGRTTSPPIKFQADELSIPTFQPKSLKSENAIDMLIKWSPDVIVVAAFGQILRKNILELPQYGCINVHASLLPRWRGAAPIQAAITNGDQETGITIMKMDPGIDTGDILNQERVLIDPLDDASTLSYKLSNLGANLLVNTLPRYLSGMLEPYQQDDTMATYAPMLKKRDGKLDFSESAFTLALKVRGYTPWPGTFCLWKGKTFKIHKAHAVILRSGKSIGKHVIWDGLPGIIGFESVLVLEEVQQAGKRRMSGEEFLRGNNDWTDYQQVISKDIT